MRRVWAAVISVWATLSIAAGIAWTSHPVTPASSGQTTVAAGTNGATTRKSATTIQVSAAAAGTHTTTRTS